VSLKRTGPRTERGSVLSLLHPYFWEYATHLHELPERENPGQRTAVYPGGPHTWTYDIFEGTEQIQQLVIARAISGLRIE